MKLTTKKELIKQVRIELDNIKKFATKKELAKLNYNNFNPSETSSCIYGLMTGSCRSKRALQLIDQCTKGNDAWIINNANIYETSEDPSIISNVCFIEFGTALEKYIMLSRSINRYNKAILKYLKGEKDTIYLD